MRKLSAIIFQEFHQTLRHPTRGIISILFYGLFAYLGIALGYTELVSSINGVPTVRWMIPGLVLFSIMILAYQNGLWRVVEKESNGYLTYLRSTTASEGLLTGAYLLSAILRALFGAALVVILFWVLWGAIGTITQWLIFFGVAAIAGIFWAGLGISLALFLKHVSLNSHILVEFFLPLLLFSGLLYPVSYYPEAMAAVTQVLPSTEAYSLARAPFGIGEWSPWLGIGLCIWSIIGVALVLISLKRERRI